MEMKSKSTLPTPPGLVASRREKKGKKGKGKGKGKKGKGKKGKKKKEKRKKGKKKKGNQKCDLYPTKHLKGQKKK